MAKWKTEGTAWYQRLPEQMRDSWQKCEPLREVPHDRDDQKGSYETWKKRSD
jgi:hypothetical protein